MAGKLLMVIVGALLVGLVAYRLVFLSPEEAVRRFEAAEPREDNPAERFLLRGRAGTTKLVANRVVDPTWGRRVGGIRYLGCVRAHEAVPALEEVLRLDPASGPRIQALLALCAIDPSRGQQLAALLVNEPDPLGDAARGVVGHGCRGGLRLHWWNAFYHPHVD